MGFDDWIECQLGDLGTIVGGVTCSKTLDGAIPGGIPWFMPKDLAQLKGRFVTDSGKYVSKSKVRKNILPANTVLFSSRGSVGYVAIAANELSTSQGFNNIIPNTQKIDPMFLYYLLKYNAETIKAMAPSTIFSEISVDEMKRIRVCIPRKQEEQKRIAEFLDSFDKKIENNYKIINKINQIIKSYYASFFANCQETCKISDYTDRIFSGATPDTTKDDYWNGKVHWISSKETRDSFIVDTEKKITQKAVKNSYVKLATKYDIIIGAAGQGKTRGQTSLLFLDTYINQAVIAIHTDRSTMPFLYWNLQNRYEELRSISSSGTCRGGLSTKILSSLPVPKVDLSDLQSFSDKVWPLIQIIEKSLQENKRLMKVRDLLIYEFFSGELSEKIDISKIKQELNKEGSD